MRYIKTLDPVAKIRIDGKLVIAEAVLAQETGGKKVVYLDREGNQIYSQPLCRSAYKDLGQKEEK